MHPVAQILDFDDQKEFQNRGTEHVWAPIHIVDAPKIDENEDSEVVEFIDKYITCALPDETKQPEMSKESVEQPLYNHLQKREGCRMQI